MFERYNEKARRAIFFARYEASDLGCDQIEADFILLGIAREDPTLTVDWLGANYEELRETVRRLYARGKEIPTSVDLPLSNFCKRVLAYASEETERMASKWIGTEHLFLGLLREPDNLATKMLMSRGREVSAVRAAVAKEPEGAPSGTSGGFGTGSAMASRGVKTRLIAEDGKELATAQWTGRLPQIDEAISVPGKNNETIYRVEDVHWRLIGDGPSSFQIREVVIKVRNACPEL